MGKVLAGYGKGKKVVEGRRLLIFNSGKARMVGTIFAGPWLTKKTVKSWQLLTTSTDRDTMEMATRGLAGWLILGPLGALVGMGSTKGAGALVAIEFKNGKRSMVQMEQDLFAKFCHTTPCQVSNINGGELQRR